MNLSLPECGRTFEVCYRRLQFDQLGGLCQSLLTTTGTRQTLVNAQSAGWSIWNRWEQPFPQKAKLRPGDAIKCHERLGGLLRYYHGKAA